MASTGMGQGMGEDMGEHGMGQGMGEDMGEHGMGGHSMHNITSDNSSHTEHTGEHGPVEHEGHGQNPATGGAHHAQVLNT